MVRLNLNGMKPKTAFLAGCLFGYIVSSVFYIWLSGALRVESYRVPTSANVYNLLNSPNHNRKTWSSYLTTFGSMGSPINKELGKPWKLATEYHVKKTLFTAVYTSRADVEVTAGILNATQDTVTMDYRIFFGGDSDFPIEWRKLPIMQLKQEQDFSSQPTVHQLFSLLKFVHKKYIGTYDWFLLASSEVYVATSDLEKLLSKLDPYTPVYMGKPGSTDPAEMADLKMIPNEYFCEGGPGIILSHAGLEAIVPFLDECLKQMESYMNEEGSGSESEFGRGDTELGRCFSRKLDIQCSTSREVGT